MKIEVQVLVDDKAVGVPIDLGDPSFLQSYPRDAVWSSIGHVIDEDEAPFDYNITLTKSKAYVLDGIVYSKADMLIELSRQLKEKGYEPFTNEELMKFYNKTIRRLDV